MLIKEKAANCGSKYKTVEVLLRKELRLIS